MDPVGSKLAIKKARKALGERGDRLQAAAIFSRSGGVMRQVVGGSVAGIAGMAAATVGGGPASGPTLQPEDLPKQFILAVVDDALVVLELSFMGSATYVGEIPRGTFVAADLGTKGGVAKRMEVTTQDGRVFTLETKYIGANRHNPDVIAAAIAAGRPAR